MPAAASVRHVPLDGDAKVRGVAALSLISVFVLIVLVQLIPGSPWDALNGTDNIGRSAIGQRWNLFAPDPPSANLATFLVVRYRDASGIRISEPADLSSAARRASRSSPWAPPKLVRVVTKLNVAFEAHAYADARSARAGRVDTSRELPDTFVREVERRRARSVAVDRRLLSAAAPRVVPATAEVLGVRGLVVRTAVNPFSHRHVAPVVARPKLIDPEALPALLSRDVLMDVSGQQKAPSALIFDSGWLPYERDVESLAVPIR